MGGGPKDVFHVVAYVSCLSEFQSLCDLGVRYTSGLL